MTRLALVGVTKTFARTVALRNVDLAVAAGELVAVLGPSGSGKTTLLRAIAGLDVLDSGTVAFDGVDVTRCDARARNVGMVFQDFALFPHVSVRENIAFGLRARHVAGRDARVLAAARQARIEPLLERKPATLSGGEKQRVAIARVLACAPVAYLFDEPFASLDTPLRATLRVEFAELRAQLDAAMLFVTHDQGEALALGDRIAVMRGGSIEQIGTADELLAAPATRFVAEFVGLPPRSVIDGAIVRGAFVAHGCEFVRVAAPDGPAALAIPPAGFDLRAGGRLAGTVRLIETIGAGKYASILIGTETLVVALGDHVPRAGERVSVDVRAAFSNGWLFDAAGRRIAEASRAA